MITAGRAFVAAADGATSSFDMVLAEPAFPSVMKKPMAYIITAEENMPKKKFICLS